MVCQRGGVVGWVGWWGGRCFLLCFLLSLGGVVTDRPPLVNSENSISPPRPAWLPPPCLTKRSFRRTGLWNRVALNIKESADDHEQRRDTDKTPLRSRGDEGYRRGECAKTDESDRVSRNVGTHIICKIHTYIICAFSFSRLSSTFTKSTPVQIINT